MPQKQRVTVSLRCPVTMHFVIEDSPESFIAQFKPYAAQVELLSRIEGSPMLECLVMGKVLHVLERTNPYASAAGTATILLNATSTDVTASSDTGKHFDMLPQGRLKAHGVVLLREVSSLIVDVGVPLVLSVVGSMPATVAAGDWVAFEALAPLHGFVVLPEKRQVYRRPEGDGDSL